MPPEIFENRAVFARVPAWHRLGHVTTQPVVIDEAVNIIGGLPVIEKRALSWPDGTPSPWYGLARIGGDGKVAYPFAPVGTDYRLVTPDEFAHAWKIGTVNAEIETMGVLANGKIMFITSPLPGTEVGGDEVQRYIAAVNYMDGMTADAFTTTTTRIVCQNTLNAALHDAASVFRVAHNTEILEATIGWITDAYQTALQRAETVREAMELMAGRRLVHEEIAEVVGVTAPMPTLPQPSGSPVYDARRIEAWERTSDQVRTERSTILALYAGAGLGMETKAADGTAFGLYNAIAEAYEYVIPGTNQMTQAKSFLFGDRHYAVQRGFNQLVTLSRN